MRAPLIAVVGKGRNCPPETFEKARRIGWRLAGSGLTVLTGGLAGVMDGAAKGAKEAGGQVVVLLPGEGLRNEGKVTEYADVAIDTGMPPQVRNYMMATACDGMVALPGSHGTMQELVCAVDVGRPVWIVDWPEAPFPPAYHWTFDQVNRAAFGEEVREGIAKYREVVTKAVVDPFPEHAFVPDRIGSPNCNYVVGGRFCNRKREDHGRQFYVVPPPSPARITGHPFLEWFQDGLKVCGRCGAEEGRHDPMRLEDRVQ